MSFFPTFGQHPLSADMASFRLQVLIDTAIAEPDDPVTWEELLNRLKDCEDVEKLPIYHDAYLRQRLEDAFFTYVENRDAWRGARIAALAQRTGHWIPDSHAHKIQSLVELEGRTLQKILTLSELSSPAYICHIGCGGAPETLLYLKSMIERGDIAPIPSFIGIDNRTEAAANANNIFSRLGHKDCQALTVAAENFQPPTAPGIIMTAAYLHPHKADILQKILGNIHDTTIIMVRNMINGQALFDDVVVTLDGATYITSTTDKNLGVRTDYYIVCPVI